MQLLVDRDRADAMGAEGRPRRRDPVAEYDAGAGLRRGRRSGSPTGPARGVDQTAARLERYSIGATRRLLLFNLATDADDPILGFTHDWIRSLAARVERVDVVTMWAGRLDVPRNVRVHSVGKELGHSEPRRAVELYRIFARLGWLRGYDACSRTCSHCSR